MSNVVSIVGRPNVGKSTLFNRLIEKRQAITHDTAGTTRDRQYGECIWNGIVFVIVDTGGYNSESKDVITSRIRRKRISRCLISSRLSRWHNPRRQGFCQ